LVIDENFDGRYEDKKSAEFICQGCRKNKAFFMCAGCSRQWYCSKECQVSFKITQISKISKTQKFIFYHRNPHGIAIQLIVQFENEVSSTIIDNNYER
jgi:hypothetical protein